MDGQVWGRKLEGIPKAKRYREIRRPEHHISKFLSVYRIRTLLIKITINPVFLGHRVIGSIQGFS